MTRKIFSVLAAMVFTFAASAYNQSIDNIDIQARICPDGSVEITELWNVVVASGTEWYLVRENLGEIDIRNLKVRDHTTETDFVNVGEWDTDLSLEQKKGRCGIVHKHNGMELCWGVGSYGPHLFEVSYTMTNAVEALDDYDILHLQLVSPGLSARPQNVLVEISAAEVQIDTTNTLGWGFGFAGGSYFEDGKYILGSTEPFSYNSSVIVLMRFNKGMFSPATGRNIPFQEVYDMAMEGADFSVEDEDIEWWKVILGFLTFFFGIAWMGKAINVHNQKKILGCKLKEVGWYRDIPMKGDLIASSATLSALGKTLKGNSIASALILRMIYQNVLKVSKNAYGKVEISFNDANTAELDPISKKLYKMMWEASGKDMILQDREFSKWSAKNVQRVNEWVLETTKAGKENLKTMGYIDRPSSYTPKGQDEARNLMGFKNYLNDFTISGEREVNEVRLWKEMLVFASLFGIADTVAKQLKDINPQVFEQEIMYDYMTMHNILRATDSLSRSITNSVQAAAASSGAAGHGGSTSFGGGGGFHGGGFGGGSR